jgi:hypothetical protein
MILPRSKKMAGAGGKELRYNKSMKEDDIVDVVIAFLTFIGFVVCFSIGAIIATLLGLV